MKLFTSYSFGIHLGSNGLVTLRAFLSLTKERLYEELCDEFFWAASQGYFCIE